MTIKQWPERANEDDNMGLTSDYMEQEIDELREALNVYRLRLAKDTVESDIDTILRQSVEIAELKSELAKLKQQEPVALVKWNVGGLHVHLIGDVSEGDELYIAAGAGK